jgi:hypothetical protein
MALEFPEGFPFNRRHPAVKSAEQVMPEPPQLRLALEVPEAPVPPAPVAPAPAAPVTAAPAEMPRSKADEDFEAAIAYDTVDAAQAPKPSTVIRTQRPAPTPLMRLVGADQMIPQRPIRERRRSPRQTLVAKATVRSDVQATVVASGFVSNISMAGVGFHTRRPLQVGEKYQLRIEVGPMKWASRLRVVTCKPVGDTWDVGAEFVGNDLAQLARREIAA